MRMQTILRRLLLTMLLVLAFASAASALPASSPQAAPKGVRITTVSGKKYLVNTTTKKRVTGYTGIKEYPAGSKNYYFFKNKYGEIHTNCFIKQNNTTYCVRPTGILWKGWWNNGKAVRYYDPVTLKKVYGWKKIGKYYHYFAASTGNLKTGFITVDGYRYYLNPKNNGARAYGWRTIGGKKYYFGAYARMKTGVFVYNKARYYANKDGQQQTGLIRHKNFTYYFDSSTGKAVSGWKVVSGKKYYFNPKNNAAVTGWQTLGGKKYYFSSTGIMQKGWITLDNRKYYMNPTTGVMTTGKVTIGGKTYDFGTRGYLDITPTGEWNIKVNLSTCVVTVYRGNTPVKAILCSPGLNGATPTGVRYIGDKLSWHPLNGGVWGKYCSHLVTVKGTTYSSYLFHSVYYHSVNSYDLATDQFRLLGQPASMGCIRLAAGDAYYIYANCPVGTKVDIQYFGAGGDPLGKPAFKYANWTGSYDPTDPMVY